MIEKIQSVISVHNIEILGEYNRYDGYRICTNKADYYFVIDNGQACCEEWGYLSTPDDLDSFVGADLISISKVSTNDCAKRPNLKEMIEDKYEPAETMFVNVETSNGLLQFAAYNQHNGYYGHDVLCFKIEKIAEDCL